MQKPNNAPAREAIKPPKGFKAVVFAHDLPLCECCEEPFCHKHGKHYSDCGCLGPTEDDVVYKVFGRKLFGKRVKFDKAI